MWAAGVVLYIMLCGCPPFYVRLSKLTFFPDLSSPDVVSCRAAQGRTHKDIFEQIKAGRWGFHGEMWREISDEAKDCVRCLLEDDPAKRPSVAKALDHPFLADETTDTIPDTPLSEVRQQQADSFKASRAAPDAQPCWVCMCRRMSPSAASS